MRNLILNYLVFAAKNKTEITVWSKAERNLIDIEDIVFIVNELLKINAKPSTVNIASRKRLLV